MVWQNVKKQPHSGRSDVMSDEGEELYKSEESEAKRSQSQNIKNLVYSYRYS